jgi:hypothetical protein
VSAARRSDLDLRVRRMIAGVEDALRRFAAAAAFPQLA